MCFPHKNDGHDNNKGEDNDDESGKPGPGIIMSLQWPKDIECDVGTHLGHKLLEYGKETWLSDLVMSVTTAPKSYCYG